MRVLLDEQLDRRLKASFDANVIVTHLHERGWGGTKNGRLLRLSETEFDVLVTMDKGIEHQQNLAAIDLGIIVIYAVSNRRADVEPLMPEVNKALQSIQAGQLVKIGLREKS
jgi:predicted nuclease of predicted toxin-antitoxin system